MRRRHTIRAMVVWGSACLAGCGSDDNPSLGNDDDPFEAEPSDLLPPVSVLEDAGDITCEPKDEIEAGLTKRAQVNAAYRGASCETTFTFVEVGAWTFADVDAAQSQFEDLPS